MHHRPDPSHPAVDGFRPTACPSHQTLFIPNVTTDVGLSPPYNSLFTFFGQFFDHGVDQTVKSGGTVFVPLQGRRPAGHRRPGRHRRHAATRCRPSQAFMVLTRAQNQPGPDGILGTADDIQDANNTDSPWVDQSQTYTSHPSHQVFLREYDAAPAATPGLDRQAARRPRRRTRPIPARPTARDGIGTWAAVKKQAAEKLGLLLVDTDVTNIPMLAADPYGNFIPGPARGLPQYVTDDRPRRGQPRQRRCRCRPTSCTSTRRS